MGMFDSFYDNNGNEWQTKAFDCTLASTEITERVPEQRHGGLNVTTGAHQVECIGDSRDGWLQFEDGYFIDVTTQPVPGVPAYDYFGCQIGDDDD